MSASGFKSDGCGDTVSVEVERRKDGVKSSLLLSLMVWELGEITGNKEFENLS